MHVITSRLRYDAPKARLAAFENCRGVEVHRVWTSRFGRHFLPGRGIDYLAFYLSAFWRLLRLARSGDVIVAKTDPPLISVVAGWVVRIRKARLVNWLQDLFPEVAMALNMRGFRGSLGCWLVRLRNASLNRARINVVFFLSNLKFSSALERIYYYDAIITLPRVHVFRQNLCARGTLGCRDDQ